MSVVLSTLQADWPSRSRIYALHSPVTLQGLSPQIDPREFKSSSPPGHAAQEEVLAVARKYSTLWNKGAPCWHDRQSLRVIREPMCLASYMACPLHLSQALCLGMHCPSWDQRRSLLAAQTAAQLEARPDQISACDTACHTWPHFSSMLVYVQDWQCELVYVQDWQCGQQKLHSRLQAGLACCLGLTELCRTQVMSARC